MKDTILLSVLAGILFVARQYFMKNIGGPMSEIRTIRDSIAKLLLLHQARLTNARADDGISGDLKQLSASLWATAGGIPLYRWFRFFYGLPALNCLLKSSKQLNCLSHGMNHAYQESHPKPKCAEENTKAILRLGALLGVHTTYSAGSINSGRAVSLKPTA
jgi:hypothetical protein